MDFQIRASERESEWSGLGVHVCGKHSTGPLRCPKSHMVDPHFLTNLSL